MSNTEDLFFEVCRIRVAKELNIPPDDIDMKSIIDCSKRAIVEACGRDDEEGAIINPLTDEEKKAVFSNYGPIAIGKIFNREQPFGSWVDKFEECYVSAFLKKINNQEDD